MKKNLKRVLKKILIATVYIVLFVLFLSAIIDVANEEDYSNEIKSESVQDINYINK